MEKKILELAKTYLKDNYSFLYNKECNAYEFEVYTDYTDVLDTDTLINYLNKGYSKNDIEDEIIESYIDVMADEEYRIANEIYNYINKLNPDLLIDYDKDDLRELLLGYGLIYSTVDVEYIIGKSEIPVNIMLETHEAFNHEFDYNDFSCDINKFFEHAKENIENGYLDKNDYSIITLIESQGYTVEEFLNYVNDEKASENKFFDSLYNEYLNATSGCNSLVVHRYMTLNELEELKKQEKIKINTNDKIGFVSHVYGAGSMLSISLEKPFEVDKNNCEIVIDGTYGYGVTDIYGWLKSA